MGMKIGAATKTLKPLKFSGCEILKKLVVFLVVATNH